MSQQLTDLQADVSALEIEDTILIAAILAAVSELQALEAQIASTGANNDADSLAALSTRVKAITANLATAVQQLAAAAPIVAPVVTPDPTPQTPIPAPEVPPAPPEVPAA